MTETLTAEQQSPSHQERRLEIVHFPNTDIVINNAADRAQMGHKLAELFQDGIPADWEKLLRSPEEGDPQNDPNHPDHRGPKTGSARGVVDGVSLFVKPKIYSGEEYQRVKTSKHGDISRGPQHPGFRAAVKRSHRLNSIVNEMALAPKVKEAMALPAAQALIQRHGYKSLSYVEPIIGVIDKKTGQKSLVYEYIAGAKNLSALDGDPDIPGDITNVDEELDEYLWAQGIEANNDVGQHQLLGTPDGAVYLIDAETYSKAA